MSSLLGCALFCVEFQLKEEQANINCLRLLVQNQLQRKQAKNTFYIKSKMT